MRCPGQTGETGQNSGRVHQGLIKFEFVIPANARIQVKQLGFGFAPARDDLNCSFCGA